MVNEQPNPSTPLELNDPTSTDGSGTDEDDAEDVPTDTPSEETLELNDPTGPDEESEEHARDPGKPIEDRLREDKKQLGIVIDRINDES